ncbi:hypothetical protein RV03_GL002065 [Enterococcus gallinarum]|nr:hypothetical protein RV03_GL002065 [Enterococcus gallinarum]
MLSDESDKEFNQDYQKENKQKQVGTITILHTYVFFSRLS